jgi:hypothetical protein
MSLPAANPRAAPSSPIGSLPPYPPTRALLRS